MSDLACAKVGFGLLQLPHCNWVFDTNIIKQLRSDCNPTHSGCIFTMVLLGFLAFVPFNDHDATITNPQGVCRMSHLGITHGANHKTDYGQVARRAVGRPLRYGYGI